ncbi:MAG TPA: DUF1543 domain-containing protein [Acidimicrobiales bacterium]|jgi:hypothetical protein|nr:DUF1543 domain-containing protein [Acidimicrobiales bacterium]
MHLFSVFLGGPIAPGRMGEDHEVVFVVAAGPEEAKGLARSKWRGMGRAHIDAVQRIDQIDGYQVSLTPVHGEDGDRTELQSGN